MDLVKKSRWQKWKKRFALLYAVLVIIALYHYVDWKSAAFVTGMLALFFTPRTSQPVKSFRFGWAALAFAGLYGFVPAKLFLYGACCSALLLFQDNFVRRTGRTTPFILALMSPM